MAASTWAFQSDSRLRTSMNGTKRVGTSFKNIPSPRWRDRREVLVASRKQKSKAATSASNCPQIAEITIAYGKKIQSLIAESADWRGPPPLQTARRRGNAGHRGPHTPRCLKRKKKTNQFPPPTKRKTLE